MGEQIYVLKSIGFGESKKSAFDDALRKIGLENSNIIEISSIIPEGTKEVKFIDKYNLKRYGNKIYAVISYKIDKKIAISAMGIVFKDGKGIILEVNGDNENEVKKEIEDGIKEMLEYRTFLKDGFKKIIINKAINNSNKKYVCSLIIAIFKEEEW